MAVPESAGCEGDNMQKEITDGLRRWALPLLLLILGITAFYIMKPDVAGLLYDDGMYLMSAKALFHGEGYRLTGIAGSPLFYKYPPLYPLLLATLMHITPSFPASIPWLKGVNIVLSLGALALFFQIARRQLSFWTSLGLVALLGTNWRLLEVSTELMSEPLYLVLSLLTLWLADRYLQVNVCLQKHQWLILTALSILACYTRSMGLLLIAAIAILMGLRVGLKKAVLYVGTCAVGLLPWFLWSAGKPDTTYAQGMFLIRTFQETYFQSFRADLNYETNLLSLYGNGFSELIGNFSVQFLPLLERFFLVKDTILSTLVILASSFALAIVLIKRLLKTTRQGSFSITGLYCTIYLLVLPFWSFYKFYPRFILMVLPFLWLAFIQVLKDTNWHMRSKTIAVSTLLTLTLISNGIHLNAYLHKANPDSLLIFNQKDLWHDYQSIVRYIKTQTPSTALLYTDNGDESYFYALNTNHPVVDNFIFLPHDRLKTFCPRQDKQCLKKLFREKAEATFQTLKKLHVQYLIQNQFAVIKNQYNNWSLAQKNVPISPLILELHPQALTLSARTADDWILVYRFNPDAP